MSAALVGLAPKSARPVAGSFVNEASDRGHRIRDHARFQTPAQIIPIRVVIVGGGIAGLSAAWRLQKRGFRDFVLLEMEPQPGGNSRWGQNEISVYPWAAHYVPVPGRRVALVRELFEELGVLREGKWDEHYLCFSPQERLFQFGRWEEGIEPSAGLSPRDRDEFRHFEARMQEFRASGEFTVPMEIGAKPSQLDQASMGNWLQKEGLSSSFLNWYINYATRDDYGALAADVSAWAGVHYFASREPEERGPLTWPEGNGWIVRRLLEKLGRFVRPNSMVHRIEPEAGKSPRRLQVLTEGAEYRAEAVIFAAPSFLAPYIFDHAPPVSEFQYSPWLTANLSLDRLPSEKGIEAAWDNVIYDSPGLGYVVATHQTLGTHLERTVWTYYLALAQGPPAQNRRILLEKDWGYWKEFILNDLSRAHPDIRSCVSRIDIMRLGHAMVRPAPDFIFSEQRMRLARHSWERPGSEHLAGRLFFANSDLSGFSIFEEAQYRGVKAADQVLRLVGGRK